MSDVGNHNLSTVYRDRISRLGNTIDSRLKEFREERERGNLYPAMDRLHEFAKVFETIYNRIANAKKAETIPVSVSTENFGLAMIIPYSEKQQAKDTVSRLMSRIDHESILFEAMHHIIYRQMILEVLPNKDIDRAYIGKGVMCVERETGYHVLKVTADKKGVNLERMTKAPVSLKQADKFFDPKLLQTRIFVRNSQDFPFTATVTPILAEKYMAALWGRRYAEMHKKR